MNGTAFYIGQLPKRGRLVHRLASRLINERPAMCAPPMYKSSCRIP